MADRKGEEGRGGEGEGEWEGKGRGRGDGEGENGSSRSPADAILLAFWFCLFGAGFESVGVRLGWVVGRGERGERGGW